MQKLVILFLAVATFSTAANIRAIDPEELQTIWQTVYQDTVALVKQNKIYIRSLTMPVMYNADKTTKHFIGNMTEVAQTYWEHVRQIETDDNTDCVQEVNLQLYTYNNTIVQATRTAAIKLQNTTIDSFFDAAGEVNAVTNEVIAIDAKVKACSEAECATTLQKEVARFHQDSIENLNKALDDADAALATFYVDIKKIQLDREEYKKVVDTFDDQLTQRCSA